MIESLQSTKKLPIKLTHLIGILLCACTSVYASVDADQPIKITSDQASFDHKIGLAEYKGRVLVIQGTRRLNADKLVIKRDTDNKIKVMVATGNPATFSGQSNPTKSPGYGKAKTIKYYPQQDTVDLFDDAQLTQNDDTVLSGPKLSYNFVTEVLKGNSSNKQRTTVVLQPKRAQ